MFQNVRIAELPKAVFPSAIAEIRMDDISMRVIRKDAFCAMTIFNVIISNATIQEIQSGAFSDRALIQSLEFVDVQLKNINTAAFRAGHDNFTIQHSRLSTLNFLSNRSILQSRHKLLEKEIKNCKHFFLEGFFKLIFQYFSHDLIILLINFLIS